MTKSAVDQVTEDQLNSTDGGKHGGRSFKISSFPTSIYCFLLSVLVSCLVLYLFVVFMASFNYF